MLKLKRPSIRILVIICLTIGVSTFILINPQATLEANTATISNSLSSDLISYWKLDETTNTRFDSVSSNHLSTVKGDLPATSGVIINAINFGSISDRFLAISDTTSLSSGDFDFTVTSWAYMLNTTSHRNFVMKGDMGVADRFEYALGYDNIYKRFYFAVSNGLFFLKAEEPVYTRYEDAHWHLLIGWHDASSNTINLQVDKGPVYSVSYIQGGWDTNKDFMIGGEVFSAGAMTGLIDEVGFWKRTLTAEERFQLYNFGNGLSYPFNDAPNLSRIFLPSIRKDPEPQGIHGILTQNGVPLPNIFLELRWYTGSGWTTRSSTYTNALGWYEFQSMPSLSPGQFYYVRYINLSTTTSDRLYTWHTRLLSSYLSGSRVNIGNFDIANIVGLAPPPGAVLPLPYKFQWAKRPSTVSDSYELDVYDINDGDPYFYSPQLGYVDSYTLGGVPNGFQTGTQYYWDIWVYSPDGGFGISFYRYGVILSSSSAQPEYIQTFRGEASMPHGNEQLDTWPKLHTP